MRHLYKIHPIGNRSYKNEAEEAFQDLAFKSGVKLMRRGYPDFMVIEDEEIIGFVEVKPNFDKKLRKGQTTFKIFCDKNMIPFVKWTPGEPLPGFCKEENRKSWL